jgi:hypothetical protein
LQSYQSANKSKKNLFKNLIWVLKNAEFHADFESVEKVLKKCTKKVISKNVTVKCTFFTFTHVRQTGFAYNFFLVHFLTTFSTDSKSPCNSAFFDIFFDFIKKMFFRSC